jgi:signal transduction histidine kinase/HPt (histidine-containing phosphotransfer) domain-containing protein
MSSAPPRILVVDDTPTNLRLLHAIFESEGFSVILADSGETALSEAARNLPDIVLLDVRMPGMGGMEALGKLKAMAPELQVIMVTSDADVQTAVDALKRGAEDFLVRPVQSDRLVLTVRHALERRELKAQVENLRRRKNLELELTRARDAALEMARLKSEFLARMSHEIRTPLNAMIGLTELLLLSETRAGAHQKLETIYSSGQLLLTVINDILDFSKLDAGKLVLDKISFELTELLKDTVEAFATMAFHKGLALDLRIDPEVPHRLRGDPARLRQVLNNIISNALKFTPQGHIDIAVTKLEEAKDNVVLGFEIQDTGIGIPAEVHERLFQPFIQADGSTSRAYGGTGLGLAIAARTIEQMHGRISFRSEPGIGSTFYFSARFGKESVARTGSEAMSAARCAAPAREANVFSEPKPDEPQWHRRIEVLVVEDNKANRFVSPLQLAALGYTAVAVEDGFKALEALAHRDYGIALMDCEMPGIDGYETTAEIRRREGSLRHTVIIAVTAHAFAAIRDRCLAAGMDDYLAKPVTLKALAATLDRWARRIVSGQALCTAAGRPLEGAALPWRDLDLAYVEEMRALSSIAGRDVLQDLVDSFLSELPELLAAVKSACGAGALEELRTTAHALKGAASTVGASGFATLCKHLHDSAERSDLNAARSGVETVLAAAEGLPELLRNAVEMQPDSCAAVS